MCNNQKTIIFKSQEAIGILSSLGLKTPFSKVPVLGKILF